VTNRKTPDALEIIGRITGDDPIRRAAIEHEVLNSETSLIVQDLRKRAGLTQKAVADLIGTKQSAVSWLGGVGWHGARLGCTGVVTDVTTGFEPEPGSVRKRSARNCWRFPP
jgi:hypothetical protein